MKNIQGEIWKPVLGWEGVYEVSNLGRVRRRGYSIVGSTSAAGYLTVTLAERHSVHQLVAEAFIRPLAEDEEVHHRDYLKTNNLLENLSIETRETHKAKHRRTTVRYLTKEEVLYIRSHAKNTRGRPRKGGGKYKTLKELAAELQVSVATVMAARSGKTYAYIQ